MGWRREGREGKGRNGVRTKKAKRVEGREEREMKERGNDRREEGDRQALKRFQDARPQLCYTITMERMCGNSPVFNARNIQTEILFTKGIYNGLHDDSHELTGI